MATSSLWSMMLTGLSLMVLHLGILPTALPVNAAILPPRLQLQRVLHLTSPSSGSEPLPLVIWHGLGDNYEADGLRSVGELAQQVNPGTRIHYVHLGDQPSDDRKATFWGNLTEQLATVCEQLAHSANLSGAPAVNALGFSQGGQFLRGYIERCNDPPVANFVTFGSQHNGIAEFERCKDGDWLCSSWEAVLRSQTWSHLAQNRLVPAQYFRDANDLEAYLENSNWLADINNERPLRNTTYADNIRRLGRFVMYIFDDDTTVVPKESGWFSEVNRTAETETKLRDRALYKEDWLGLRALDEKGGLVFESTPGRHMNLTQELLTDVFAKYFSAEASR